MDSEFMLLHSICASLQTYKNFFFSIYILIPTIREFNNSIKTSKFIGIYALITFPKTAISEMLTMKNILYISSHIFLYCSIPAHISKTLPATPSIINIIVKIRSKLTSPDTLNFDGSSDNLCVRIHICQAAPSAHRIYR